jgi:hypothetical protein
MPNVPLSGREIQDLLNGRLAPATSSNGRNLPSQAVAARVKGRLAEQLQVALDHRNRVERAKGMLMVRERIDDTAAFERLRSTARSSRRPLIDVVDEVLGGQRLAKT